MPQPQNAPSPEDQLTAEFHADVSVERIASVYAKALLMAARTAGQTGQIAEEFESLLRDVLPTVPRLQTVLESPLVGVEDKERLLDGILASQASPLFLNFLKVVARRGRLDTLRAIHGQFRQMRDAVEGRVRVQLQTAVPVEPEALASLAASLAAVLGGAPAVDQVLRPELIGGAVVRIGDTVYDASVATQLENLRKQMVERSIHEIQSRRDRFRTSTRD